MGILGYIRNQKARFQEIKNNRSDMIRIAEKQEYERLKQERIEKEKRAEMAKLKQEEIDRISRANKEIRQVKYGPMMNFAKNLKTHMQNNKSKNDPLELGKGLEFKGSKADWGNTK